MRHLNGLFLDFPFNDLELFLGVFLLLQILDLLQFGLDVLDRLADTVLRQDFLRLLQALFSFV
jgi:hypothetical protein